MTGVETRLAELSLSCSSNGAAGPAHRAFFVTLHLLHSHLLPSASSGPRSVATSESNASSTVAGGPPPASSFLPAFEAAVAASGLATHFPPPRGLDLPVDSSGRPYSRHRDPHLDFLLRLRVALEDNQYSDLASNLLSLAAIPSLPPSVLAHLKALHLSTRDRRGEEQEHFHPLATLLQTFVPRVRQNRIWPTVQRAYRFPPDSTEWLGSALLFEFEVELEEASGAATAVEPTRTGPTGRRAEQIVAEDWDTDLSAGEAETSEAHRERIRTEAARRAAQWVAERTKR